MLRTIRLRVGLAVAAVLVLATALDPLGAMHSGAVAAGWADIAVTDSAFTPSDLSVDAGDTVQWRVMEADGQHTVTADNGSFDSPVLVKGDVFEFTFSGPDTYSYYCRFHGEPGGIGMAGRVTVREAPTATTTTTTEPPEDTEPPENNEPPEDTDTTTTTTSTTTTTTTTTTTAPTTTSTTTPMTTPTTRPGTIYTFPSTVTTAPTETTNTTGPGLTAALEPAAPRSIVRLPVTSGAPRPDGATTTTTTIASTDIPALEAISALFGHAPGEASAGGSGEPGSSPSTGAGETAIANAAKAQSRLMLGVAAALFVLAVAAGGFVFWYYRPREDGA